VTARATLGRISAPLKRLPLGERLVRRNPLYYPRVARLFERLDAAPLEQRRAWTAARLARVLRAAAATGYGRRVGGGPDPGAWPLLDPATVRDDPPAFMRGGWWSVPSSTGGTTGIPLPLARSHESVAAEQAALDHLLRGQGVDPVRARVAVLRGDDIKPPDDLSPPFWTGALGGRRLIFSSNHLQRATLPRYLEALTEYAADYWWVYPSTLESLCRLAAGLAAPPRVPLIVSSSEVLSAWCRAAAAATFGARVVDYYGQAERVAFAASAEPERYRFQPGYANVELLPAGEDADGARYEIVGTGLWNTAMPLVRYRTGDLIRVAGALSPAGREALALGLGEFPGILGRDAEVLVGLDGATLTGMDHVQRGVEHVVRIQLVHERADRVEIRVIPAPGYGDADRAQLIANARRKIPAAIGVSVREVDALERTALGKTPFIVRRPGVPGPTRPEDRP